MKLYKVLNKAYKLALRLERYIKYLTKHISISNFESSLDSQIIICGIPRSGTSLFFNMLNSTLRDFQCYYGLKFKNKKSRESSALNVITRKGNYITKRPDDIFNVKDIIKYNIRRKKLIIFVMIRDFRDVVTSKHQWGDGSYYLGLNKKNMINGRVLKNRGLIQYLMEIEKIRLNKKKIVSRKVAIEIIKYEELFEKPTLVIDILNKHNIENKGLDSMIEYESVYNSNEKSSKGLKKIRGRWKKNEHDQRISKQFSNEQVRQFLIDYGYEKDHEWFKRYKIEKD